MTAYPLDHCVIVTSDTGAKAVLTPDEADELAGTLPHGVTRRQLLAAAQSARLYVRPKWPSGWMGRRWRADTGAKS